MMRRDVLTSPARTALVVLSIAVGVFCVGMVLGARGTILDALAQQYRATSPANTTLVTDPIGEKLLRSAGRVAGVTAVEGRYAVDTRIETQRGTWKDLVLFAIPDFGHMRLNRILPQRGAWPPPRGTLLVERTSLDLLGLQVGSRIRLEMPSGHRRALTISGTAHDVVDPTASVSGFNYGYITFSTLASLGHGRAFNQLYLRTSGDPHDTARVWSIAEAVRTALARGGRKVYSVVVPQPGRLWVYDPVRSMLLLLTILGVASLVMSGFLVVNTMTAEITRQIRQVGIMKAIGARPRQIGGLYLGTVVMFSLLALCVGIPLGMAGAVGLIRYATNFLDFDATGIGLSPGVLELEVVAGVGVPLLAALVPVHRGSRITVREAITDYGTGGGGATRVGQTLERIPALPDPLVLGIGNTFRRKGRLIMTLVAVSLGGACFIAALSVRASLLNTLDDIFGYRNYDVQITLSHAYPGGQVARVAAGVPGVTRTEGWGVAAGERSGVTGLAAETVSVVAPPAGSKLIKPVVLHGRWLRPDDGMSMVVNSDLVADQPDLHVGTRVRYVINGQASAWSVVGIVRGVQNGPIAYVTYRALTVVTGQRGLVDRLVAVTARHDPASEISVSRAIETRLKHAGFAVDAADTTHDQRATLGANFDVIVVFLVIMAILIAVVGGLGLMGTMAISVLERTREIGIMRAVGASNRDLVQIVLAEGVVIAGLSWVIGTLVALPLAPAMSAAVGALFIHAPLAYTFSAGGSLVWLGGALLIAIAASLLPAWNACRLTVRDVLAYE
jgi:putative ABC transport system permease protein